MDNTTDKERRGFEISARTVLQLGGELISSDGVAFYELIKNAVDAGSEEVQVDVTSRLPYDSIQEARESLEGVRKDEDIEDIEAAVHAILSPLAEEVITSAPGAEELAADLEQPHTPEEAEEILDEANF